MRLSRVVESVPPSGIRRFFDIVAQMEDVISLGVGEPVFVTPWRIREAAIYAVEQGFTTYTSNAGLPELRKAICEPTRRLSEARYAPAQVTIRVRVSEGLHLAPRALLTPGDAVIYVEP